MNCIPQTFTPHETGPPRLSLTEAEFATLANTLDFGTREDRCTEEFLVTLASLIFKSNQGDLETIRFFEESLQNTPKNEAANVIQILREKGLRQALKLAHTR